MRDLTSHLQEAIAQAAATKLQAWAGVSSALEEALEGQLAWFKTPCEVLEREL